MRSNCLLQQLHIASNFFEQTGGENRPNAAPPAFPTLTMILNVAHEMHNQVDGHNPPLPRPQAEEHFSNFSVHISTLEVEVGEQNMNATTLQLVAS